MSFVSPEKSFMGRLDLMAHEGEWQAGQYAGEEELEAAALDMSMGTGSVASSMD